jgi:hypothetical protein
VDVGVGRSDVGVAEAKRDDGDVDSCLQLVVSIVPTLRIPQLEEGAEAASVLVDALDRGF